MGRLEVNAAVVDFVVFDDDEAGDCGQDGDVVEGGVDVGALFLLFAGVGGLDDKDGLDEEEESGGVEELGERSCQLDCYSFWVWSTYGMGREEHQVIREDRSPDYGCDLSPICQPRVCVPSH